MSDTVISQRVWRFDSEDPKNSLLYPIIMLTPWLQHQPTPSVCAYNDTHTLEGPEMGCPCGIAATDRIETLRNYADWPDIVIGEVLLSGKILRLNETTDPNDPTTQYKAQYGYPHRLYFCDTNESFVRNLGRAYGVPIMSNSSLYL